LVFGLDIERIFSPLCQSAWLAAGWQLSLLPFQRTRWRFGLVANLKRWLAG